MAGIAAQAGTARAFGDGYAEIYDLLYKDKDYDAECDRLEWLWTRFAARKPSTVLDLGCGTGGHALPLCRRGYQVTGIDQSEAMIRVAREKACRAGLDLDFHVMPMQELALPRQFDAITCMFQAINYVLSERDLSTVFRNVSGHLNPGGQFLFDFRNGIPSVRSHSPMRVRKIEANGRTLLRVSENKLDAMEQLFRTTYTSLLLEDDRVIQRATEVHVVRFFYPREVRYALEQADFEVLAMCAFPEVNRPATEEDWDIIVVARGAER
jgi:2-polyprenyl-3-methyl-5-hydroxy-6-metoxy-1,4-benzoquinol methylase